MMPGTARSRKCSMSWISSNRELSQVRPVVISDVRLGFQVAISQVRDHAFGRISCVGI
jgi:hypothetical protein